MVKVRNYTSFIIVYTLQASLLNFAAHNEMRSTIISLIAHGALIDGYIIHISKFKLGTVEKNSPAGIEPTPLRWRCSALATELRR